MSKSITKILFVVSMLACGSLSFVMVQAETSSATEKTAIDHPTITDSPDFKNPPIESFLPAAQPAVQAYIAFSTAILERDYKTAWNQCCTSYRQGAWGNSFEKFEQYYLKRLDGPYERRRKIDEAKVVSASEVHFKVATGQTFVMSYEDGKWCQKGNLADLSAGNFNDLR